MRLALLVALALHAGERVFRPYHGADLGDDALRGEPVVLPAVLETLGLDDPLQDLTSWTEHRVPCLIQPRQNCARDLELVDPGAVRRNAAGDVAHVLVRDAGATEEVDLLLLAAVQP